MIRRPPRSTQWSGRRQRQMCIRDRRKLGQIVFEDGAQLKKLNDIMQPAISSAMADKINFWRLQNVPILVLDVPLLFERDYDKNKSVDKIIVVTASKEIQLFRLENRDQLSNMEARNRVKAQLPMSQKIARADYVIDLSLIHISEPTRRLMASRMPSSA